MSGSGLFNASILPLAGIPQFAPFSQQFLFCNSLLEGYINALILTVTKHFERFSFITFVNH